MLYFESLIIVILENNQSKLKLRHIARFKDDLHQQNELFFEGFSKKFQIKLAPYLLVSIFESL